jgi:predicted nucleotide-binding protein
MGKLEEVVARLEGSGLAVEQNEVQDGHHHVWVDSIDAVANVYENGTCYVQGRGKARMEEVLGELVGKSKGRQRGQRSTITASPAIGATPHGTSSPKTVFVVYGHDRDARNELEAMLRRWGLEPLILDQLPSGGHTIIEKLEHYQSDVEWAVVLMTPDDVGALASEPARSAHRPRQNVVLETGMLLGRLGRKNVAMLYKVSDPPMELPSDIHGYIYIPFTKTVKEAASQLATEMENAGFHVIPASKL